MMWVISSIHGKDWAMINGKRIAVVMPAYNAEKTLETTVRELPESSISRFWSTTTAPTARSKSLERLGLQYYVHDRTTDTGATSRPATAKPSRPALTSSSWSIRITSTRHC